MVVGNDKIKSLPDFVAARLPGGMPNAVTESDAAKVAPKSKALARAAGKPPVLIVRINRIVQNSRKRQQSQPRHSPAQRSIRAGARKAISYQLNATLVAEAVSDAGLAEQLVEPGPMRRGNLGRMNSRTWIETAPRRTLVLCQPTHTYQQDPPSLLNAGSVSTTQLMRLNVEVNFISASPARIRLLFLVIGGGIIELVRRLRQNHDRHDVSRRPIRANTCS